MHIVIYRKIINFIIMELELLLREYKEIAL